MKKIADEQRVRLDASSKAYEKWLVHSHKISRPATQGLLRGSKMFIICFFEKNSF